MAAFDYQRGERKHGWAHDWLPLLIVAILCVIVVHFNVKL